MNNYRKMLLFLGDAAALIASFFITVIIKDIFSSTPVLDLLFLPFIVVGIICLIALYAADLYDFRFIRPVSSNLWRIAVALLAAPIISIIIFYTFNLFPVDPKTSLLIFFFSFGILFILWRRIFYQVASHSFKNKTVVWGISQTAEHLFAEIAHNSHRGYDPLVHVRELSELIDALEQRNFNVLIIDNSFRLPDKLIEIIFEKNIIVLPLLETYEDILQKVPLETIDETLFIQHMQKHGKISRFCYRVFECFVAIIILISTSPFLLLMIIGIKIEDNGSILYKGNTRLGFLGKEFILFKFRSMTEEHKRKGAGADWAEKNDVRVTRVGKIIRKLHIDELAQMINVLRGEISLVGPRPDVTPVGLELKKLVPSYYLRHIVKPGFTGWAQIKYHAPASHEEFIERFKYDLYHIKHREFFFDFGIMVRTLQIIFSHTS